MGRAAGWSGCGLALAALAGGAAASACGGADTGAAMGQQGFGDDGSSGEAQRATAPGPAEERDDGMQVEGLKGVLEPHAIREVIERHQGSLSRCYQDRLSGFAYLSGSVVLSFAVAVDGTVKSVKMTESSLGSWPVEKCLLDLGRAMTFSRPTGGVAEFTLPLDFESGRPVLWYSDDRAEAEISPLLRELRECRRAGGVPREVLITLYVGRRGQVSSVGFSSEGKRPISDEWAECAEAKILEWMLTDPRGQVAKLTVSYRR